MWSVTVHGHPQPKGSMKCIGGRGKIKHQLIEDDKTGARKPWRLVLNRAGEAIVARAGETLAGPVSVEVTWTLDRPRSAPRDRMWPTARGTGDDDKLARMLLDAFEDVGVFTNDSQVVELTTRKTYPDNPACPGALDRPGAVIHLWRTEAS